MLNAASGFGDDCESCTGVVCDIETAYYSAHMVDQASLVSVYLKLGISLVARRVGSCQSISIARSGSQSG